MSLEVNTKVQYFYPTANQFPFDKACRNILHVLEKHNWKYPDIKITFTDFLWDSTSCRRVKSIESKKFKIVFERHEDIPIQYWPNKVKNYQNKVKSWMKVAVSSIQIPKKELQVYGDESGPTLHTYVGNDWKKVKNDFKTKPIICSHKVAECGSYLKYNGQFEVNSESKYVRMRAPYLVIDKNGKPLLENNEPAYFKVDDVFKEFVTYLEEEVLKKIENNQPLKKTIHSRI